MRKQLELLLLVVVLAVAGVPALQQSASGAIDCPEGEWSAEFFSGQQLVGTPVLERCDAAVDFDWVAGSPGAPVPVNQFSARWTQEVQLEAGSYRFEALADDGVRVLLDGQVVVDGWRDQPATPYTQTVPVTAGVHLVVVEYYEAWGDATLQASFTQVGSGTPTECGAEEWSAELFTGRTLAGDPVLTRCDAAVDFDWGAGSPGTGVPVNQFSARWTRHVQLAAGDYRFDAVADDGVRLLVDGQLVLDGWKDQGSTSYSATVPLTAGEHVVTVEYYEAYGDAMVGASFEQTTPSSGAECTEDEWAVDFFRGRTLAGDPVLTRCDAAVDFDWGAGTPGAGVPVNQFSARWTREVVLEEGQYRFTATADDGVRILLDGEVVLDGWKDQGATTYETTAPVTAGSHLVEVEYFEGYGDATVRAGYELDGPIQDERGLTGQWTRNPRNMPVRAIHSTLLPTGDVLLIAGSGNNEAMFDAGTFTATLWDPEADTFTDVPVPEDMFCAGHAHLPDGDVMVAGGNNNYPDETRGYGGLASNYAFDVQTGRFVKLPSMREGRWYPTLTMLGNGDITVVGGINQAGNSGTVLVERFDGVTRTWDQDVKQRWAFWGLYPSLHLMEDGKLLYSGTNTFGNALPGAALWDLASDTVQDLPLTQPDLRDQSASVLLPPAQDQKVMVMGGGKSYTGETATSSTFIHDMEHGTHTAGPPLSTTKMYVNAVILPDRTVLETGGADTNNSGGKHETSIYDPEAGTFTTVPGTPAIDRMYHSSALLLPDGRVAVFGSNPDDGSFEMRISVYSPAYLFRGPRPTVSQVPSTMRHGGTYDLAVTSAEEVRDVSLVRPMSVTHQLDPNARLVDVPMTRTATGVRVTLPDNPNLLPPGPYMLYVTDEDGVPSVASFVNVPVSGGGVTPASFDEPCTGDVECCCPLAENALHSLPPQQVEPTVTLAAAAPDTGSEQPWWTPGPDGLRPGETDYGPDGGPEFTATNIGDGCDRNYTGEDGTVCVPLVTRRAPELDKPRGEVTECEALREAGYLDDGLVVVDEDRQGLDPDGDGRACEAGES